MADIDDLLSRLAVVVAVGADSGVPLPERLCRAATAVLGGDGGAITLAYTHPERVTLCTTDEAALTIEDAQDVLGQGPGAEAFRSGQYVRLDVGTTTESVDPRWPLLSAGEISGLAPVAIHALPLVRSAVVLGVLTVHRRGADGDIDVDDARTVARALAAALLADGPATDEAGAGGWSERAEVHQATGMVVAQLRVSEDDALALIRAHAYSHEQSVPRTAHDIVERRVTFSSSSTEGIEST